MIHMLHTDRTMAYFQGTVKYFSKDSTFKILRTRPTKETKFETFHTQVS